MIKRRDGTRDVCYFISATAFCQVEITENATKLPKRSEVRKANVKTG